MSMIGRVLGDRFRVVRSIGRGGMGAVYEAIDQREGGRVAIKVLLDELANDPTCKERFRREAELAASLSHPALVAVHVVSLETTPPFLAMELIDGASLSRVLAAEGRLPWRRAGALAHDALRALSVMHGAGIVHRDLKPANVLVVRDGEHERGKLIDLGVAQLTTGAAYRRLTASGAIVGTPAYMSPEQLAGGTVGPASDLWSVGVLLHECLTGERPFASPDLATLIRAVTSSDPTPIETLAPDVPRAMGELVRSLLRKSPADRPASAVLAAEALRASIESPPELTNSAALAVGQSLAGLSEPARPQPPPEAERGTEGRRDPLVAARSEASASAPTHAALSPIVADPAAAAPRPLTPTRTGMLRLALAGIAGASAMALVGLGCVGAGALGWWASSTYSVPIPPGTEPREPSAAPRDEEDYARPRRLEITLDGPYGRDAFGEVLAPVTRQLGECIALEGHALGVVAYFTVWLSPAGTVESLDLLIDAMTPTERACAEAVLRSTPWPPQPGAARYVQVNVGAFH